jgi:hypothetical protein
MSQFLVFKVADIQEDSLAVTFYTRRPERLRHQTHALRFIVAFFIQSQQMQK